MALCQSAPHREMHESVSNKVVVVRVDGGDLGMPGSVFPGQPIQELARAEKCESTGRQACLRQPLR